MPDLKPLYSSVLGTTEAHDIQESELAARVDTKRPLTAIESVAGADVSYELRGKWLPPRKMQNGRTDHESR